MSQYQYLYIIDRKIVKFDAENCVISVQFTVNNGVEPVYQQTVPLQLPILDDLRSVPTGAALDQLLNRLQALLFPEEQRDRIYLQRQTAAEGVYDHITDEIYTIDDLPT